MTPRIPRPNLDPVLRLVDLDQVLAHIDVNALVERIDLNAVLERVDVNAVLERVDLNAVLERVDIEQLVQQSDVGQLLVDSSSSVGMRLLDALRSQLVGLDRLVFRGAMRLLRRDVDALPLGPPRLVEQQPR